MPGTAYAGRLAGALVLGLIAMVAAFVAFTFALPYLLVIGFGTLFLVLIFLAIWGIIYTAMFLGVAIYYFFKPMKVSKQDKGYSIAKTEEAGKRQKSKD